MAEVDEVRLEKTCADKQLSFMMVVKEYPVLLNKSQLPVIALKKKECYPEVIKKLQGILGTTFDKDSLTKKLSRMKNDVKAKCDAKRTGNKPIVLRPWEKIMLDLIHGETNPSITKITGAVTVGTTISSPAVISGSSVSSNASNSALMDSSLHCSTALPPPAINSTSSDSNSSRQRLKENLKRKKVEAILNAHETNETRLLTTIELQRLVLLEQLQLIKLKRQKLEGNEKTAKAHSDMSHAFSIEFSPGNSENGS